MKSRTRSPSSNIGEQFAFSARINLIRVDNQFSKEGSSARTRLTKKIEHSKSARTYHNFSQSNPVAKTRDSRTAVGHEHFSPTRRIFKFATSRSRTSDFISTRQTFTFHNTKNRLRLAIIDTWPYFTASHSSRRVLEPFWKWDHECGARLAFLARGDFL